MRVMSSGGQKGKLRHTCDFPHLQNKWSASTPREAAAPVRENCNGYAAQASKVGHRNIEHKRWEEKMMCERATSRR